MSKRAGAPIQPTRAAKSTTSPAVGASSASSSDAVAAPPTAVLPPLLPSAVTTEPTTVASTSAAAESEDAMATLLLAVSSPPAKCVAAASPSAASASSSTELPDLKMREIPMTPKNSDDRLACLALLVAERVSHHQQELSRWAPFDKMLVSHALDLCRRIAAGDVRDVITNTKTWIATNYRTFLHPSHPATCSFSEWLQSANASTPASFTINEISCLMTAALGVTPSSPDAVRRGLIHRLIGLVLDKPSLRDRSREVFGQFSVDEVKHLKQLLQTTFLVDAIPTLLKWIETNRPNAESQLRQQWGGHTTPPHPVKLVSSHCSSFGFDLHQQSRSKESRAFLKDFLSTNEQGKQLLALLCCSDAKCWNPTTPHNDPQQFLSVLDEPRANYSSVAVLAKHCALNATLSAGNAKPELLKDTGFKSTTEATPTQFIVTMISNALLIESARLSDELAAAKVTIAKLTAASSGSAAAPK